MLKELRKPSLENCGDGKGKWFVETKDIPDGFDTFGALYANGKNGVGEINIMLGSDNSMYYFDTLYEAHEAASYYYAMNGELYPYQQDWYNDCVDKSKPVDDGSAQVESQVMEF